MSQTDRSLTVGDVNKARKRPFPAPRAMPDRAPSSVRAYNAAHYSLGKLFDLLDERDAEIEALRYAVSHAVVALYDFNKPGDLPDEIVRVIEMLRGGLDGS